MTAAPALIVISKAPVPGRSKTRLSPPCSPAQAAALARAALQDTLAAVVRTPASRHVVALDGEPGDWLPSGVEVLPQRGRGLDERIANAFVDVGQPALLIGMDTPQVTPSLLGRAMAPLRAGGADAVLGECVDGGYWALGLREPDAAAVVGVPMGEPYTGKAQRLRLDVLGLRCAQLPELRDVDFMEDARAVAVESPGTRFAGVVREVLRELDAV